MTAAPGAGLCVVGFVYLEVFLPTAFAIPQAGHEVFLPSLPVGFGGALNVASVAAALDAPVMIRRPSSGPLDPAVRALTESLGIEDHVWPSRRAAVSLVFPSPSDRAFLSTADFDALSDCPPLPASAWIHVAGLEEAFRLEDPLREARTRGARVCVSGSWAPPALHRIARMTDRRWDLIVLNEDEAAAVHEERGRVPDLLARVAGDVVITNGPARVDALIEGRRLRVPVPDPRGGGDFTGVGDAFCAGLLCALMRGRGAESALRFGVEVATRVVGIRGGVVTDRALLAGVEMP